MFGFKNCMQISSIKSSFLSKRIQNTKITMPFIQKNNNQGDIFVSFKGYDYPKRILQDKMKFGISDYMKLSAKEIENIRKNKCADLDRERADINIELAIELKENLDKEYGEGNYVFEAIGTSPAPIARVMEFMGVETHYLPISNLRTKDEYMIFDILDGQPSWAKKPYEEYLHKQGVSPDMLERNNKHYLFFDYTCSGHTLAMYKKILQQEFNIPVSDRIKFLSLNQKMYEFLGDELIDWEREHNALLNYENKSEKSKKIMKYVEHNFRESVAALYAGIPTISISMLRDIKDADKVNLHRWENYQAYNFCVIDKLNEMGLLKQNPLNNGVL